jgi:vancomycin resistance protein VanJ
LRSAVVVSAYGYPAVLVAIALCLRYVGESHWVTTLGLFLPRVGFALPLPFIALGLWIIRRRALLLSQLVALLVLLFPLMGLVVPWPTGEKQGQPALRLLSFNVDSGYVGYGAVCERIFEQAPDVVLIQEAGGDQAELVKILSSRYPHVQASTQFVIASRHRIIETAEPEKIPYYDRQRSARFVRYSLDTSIGVVALYNVHPISPRGVLQLNRGRAALHLLRTGELFAGDPAGDVGYNAGLRAQQIEHVARMAAKEKHPVVVAGDLNLPGLSATLARHLGGYADGFRAAGSGFGYTFPAKFPFLRLDRIFASDALRVTGFEVGCKGLSDHFCVVADLQRR